ncbi:hypothetical protein HD554DRAFT_2035513 [Boletus coccyginus]|nr:hypothetical protein HD554DRAFT_2035513 [Boletus coccyginus]
MPKSRSKKQHHHASTTGKGVPSVWLPNPGGTIIYISSSPPAPTSSTSPPQDTPSSISSCKHNQDVDSLPHLSHPKGDSNVHSFHSNAADDDELTQFFTAAFKLLADSISHMLDSEDKRKISNILHGFSEVLPEIILLTLQGILKVTLVSHQFIKTNLDLGSSDYEAFPLDAMWLPDESHTLQLMEVSGEADLLTTSVTPKPFRHQVYTSMSLSTMKGGMVHLATSACVITIPLYQAMEWRVLCVNPPEGTWTLHSVRPPSNTIHEDWTEQQPVRKNIPVDFLKAPATQRLAATGVGTIDCARHNMKLPTAVRDFQKGKKYTNMDYLFFSTIRHFPSLTRVFALYDIACQWSKWLWKRMETLPLTLWFDCKTGHVNFAVPKFHLPAHKEACQLDYSFNLIPWVGCMDGKAPERGWANINPVASSTKEMDPGSQRDILDDFFGNWNWKKTIKLSDVLLTKMKEAVMQKLQQHVALQELEAALPPGRVSQ